MSFQERKARMVFELRQAGVTDQTVLNAIERTPRDMFVSDAFQAQAYENHPLPIDCGQTISQPLVVGLMTQALIPDPSIKVLEIGTGSGYQTAVLAQLFRRVYTIERHAPLLRLAESRFRTMQLRTVVTLQGDGHKGWPEQAPFDRILVTAAAADIPRVLVDQLSPDGLMVLPVGPDGGDQEVVRVQKRPTHIRTERLFPVRFVPMVEGLPRKEPG
ncbi:MAG: protein-L-isoaspartate(D-aspartate) O-methyltransferase [Rhodospirillaceae bacterium]